MFKNPFQIFQIFLLLVGVGLIIYNLTGLDVKELFTRQNTGNFLAILANSLLVLAMWISLRHSLKKNKNG